MGRGKDQDFRAKQIQQITEDVESNRKEPLSHFTNNQSLNLPFMGLWHCCSISTSVKRIVRQVSSTCVTLDTAV